ncbi:MAG: hypothetical protein OEX17_05055 [Rhodospirillaceae bacterium]|nr:hypothetical protein [Rhodospirillaceae bacterium]
MEKLVSIDNTMKNNNFFIKTATAFAALLVLSSCYLPQRFDAEIEVDAAGYYSMIFDGYIADVGLYQSLQSGDLNEEQEAEKVAILEGDLSRDSSVQSLEYFKLGHFRIKWERKGDLIKSKTVTFLRRNESMLSLKYVSDAGLIEMMGRSIRQSDREKIAQMGLGMQGEIRLKTPLLVVDHNATEVKQDKNDETSQWYIWRIANIFQSTPRILLKIE